MQKMIVWLVLADSAHRMSLRTFLESSGFEVPVDRQSIAEMMGCGDKALQPPAVIVLDNAQGIAGLAMLKAAQPRARVVVLADAVQLSQLTDIFTAGADGYLPKDMPQSALVTSLRLAAAGEKVMPSALTDFLRKMQSAQANANVFLEVGDVMLSRRELDILRRVTDGQSNGKIAADLEITEAAVRVHEKRVLRKLGTTSRSQIAAWAIEHGVMST